MKVLLLLLLLLSACSPLVCDSDEDGVSGPWCDGDDCDDLDRENAPDHEEVCDGRDNDCDGEPMPDEGDVNSDGVLDCIESAGLAMVYPPLLR